MALSITCLDQIHIPAHWPQLMEGLWEAFCAQEDLPREAIVDVTFCGLATIQALNRDHRAIDLPTDVLSFPMFAADEDIRSLAGEDLLLGDIVISRDHIDDQAQAYGHSPDREALYLLAHGLLHLAGYDHMQDDDQALMRQKEEALMAKIGLSRQPVPSLQDLSQLAQEAAQAAYTPYSHFPVGAALLGSNGRVYQACNVENASYGLTSCAERNAVFAAIADGCRSFTGLAVAGGRDQVAQPCGACRQVLAEFAPDLPIRLTTLQGEAPVETSLSQLFPQAFQLQEEDTP